MQCDKCRCDMEKRNTHEASNIRFQRWSCPLCRSEKNEALGITGQL